VARGTTKANHAISAEGNKMPIMTPEKVEAKLIALSREIDEGHHDLVDAERRYHDAEYEYNVGCARTRLRFDTKDTKLRVAVLEAMVLVENADKYKELNDALVLVKAARANASRLKTQVELARSVGTSVRASYDIGG